MIIVDVNEPNSVVQACKRHGNAVQENEALPAGDFLVRDRIVERKTYPDFIGRISTDENDIFMQMIRMLEAAREQDLEPELILEGSWQKGLKRTQLPKQYVVACMGGLRKLGVSIMHTMDTDSTGRYMATLETQSVSSDPKSIRDAPSVPDSQIPMYLTQGLQNVGPVSAKKLLDHFGCFLDIVNSDEEELQQVDGIGPKTAEHIYNSVRRGWE